ncbi:YfhO family protein [Lactobacillus delbrueckii subsp. bulgaricus]
MILQFSFNKKRDWAVYWKYSVFFLFLAACVFGPYLVTGHSLIWNTDAANQHLPLLVKYREYVLSFLRHLSQGPAEWSWTMGLGSDLFSVFSYYTIGDVFAYLALLFPTSHLVFAYQLILLLRLYCVGLAFVYFARHFDFKDGVVLIGSGVYMVNAYLLYAALAQPMFTTTFILFPLIVVQLERLLQGGSAWPLFGVFVWMLVSNYYLAFVLGLGAIIYLFLRWGLAYWKKIPFWPTIKKLFFASLGAVLLSAGLLLPELLAVVNSTRTGSQFANGLTFYPAYYYLLLPKELIDGDNWKLMFWSALGLASIIMPALVYLFRNWRKYRLVAASLLLGAVMLLIPAVGAVFNGGMSASNRWTLLLYLPFAFSVMVFVKAISEQAVSQKEMRLIFTTSGIYLVYLVAMFFLENDYKLFLPVIFLLLSLGASYLVNEGRALKRALLLTVAANLAFNALYAALPYNGNFAANMLVRGEYEQIAEDRYGGLNHILPAGFYRVNTVSNNQFVSQKKLFNDLTSGLANVSSYYSIQNQYLGQFSTDLGNLQYDNNIPFHQLDDRTILNNFLGVRYIFNQKYSVNGSKVPGTYDLIATGKEKKDQNQESVYQAELYKTTEAFPLLWLSYKAISPSRYQKLSASQKERALASGVVVKEGGLKAAKLTGVKTIKTSLVDASGKKLSKNKLTYTGSDASYKLKLHLSDKEKAKLGKSELHVEISQISYQPFTLSQQLDLELKKAKQEADLAGQTLNERATRYKYWRYHLLAGSPDPSYKLTVTGKKASETIVQRSQDMTSFYRLVDSAVMNMGTYQTLPNSLTFQPSKLGTYRFKIKVVAIPLNQEYTKEVRQIQKQGVKQLKLAQNQLTGLFTSKKAGVVTSTIPYSNGWTATVDGKAVKVIKTNTAFVGFKMPAGKHRVRLVYRTPGLRSSLLISLLTALAILVYAAFSHKEWRREFRAKKKEK